MWAITDNGKRMPVDAAPREGGTIRLTHGHAHVLTGDELGRALQSGERLHYSHFATCPEASKHRGKSVQTAEAAASPALACFYCGDPVDPTDASAWRRVRGWDRRGRAGGSDIVMREPVVPGVMAHASCVERVKAVGTVDQGTLL